MLSVWLLVQNRAARPLNLLFSTLEFGVGSSWFRRARAAPCLSCILRFLVSDARKGFFVSQVLFFSRHKELAQDIFRVELSITGVGSSWFRRVRAATGSMDLIFIVGVPLGSNTLDLNSFRSLIIFNFHTDHDYPQKSLIQL
jgi:hypothetical protein